MKKKIIFPGLMVRIFGMAFDMVIICLIFTLLEPILKRIAMELTIKDLLTRHDVNVSNAQAVGEFFSSYASKTTSEMREIFLCFFLYLTLETILLLSYLVMFWRKLGGTPAKIFMRLKIVDQNTLEDATTWQLILRAFGVLFWVFGIWSIPFTKKKQALHDIFSGTVVVRI